MKVRKNMGFIRDNRRRRPGGGGGKPGGKVPSSGVAVAAPATHNVFRDGPSIRGPSGGDAGGPGRMSGGDAKEADPAGNAAPANFGGAM